MKKLLLTLGTAASIAAPLATVVACGEQESPASELVTYDKTTKTLTFEGFKMSEEGDKVEFDSLIWNLTHSSFGNATSILIKGTYGAYTYEGTADITSINVGGDTFANLKELLDYDFGDSHAWMAIFEASAVNFDAIKDELESLNLVSSHVDGTEWGFREKTVYSAQEASDTFGISQFEFNKILNVLGEDFKFEDLMMSYEFTNMPPPFPAEEDKEVYINFSSIKQPHRKNLFSSYSDKITFNPALADNLQIDGSDYVPTEDKFIVMADYFADGQLWTGDNKTGSADTSSYVDLVKGVQWGPDQGVVQVANGDSIVLVYDDADDDGYHPNNFEDTVAFVDTSIANDEAIMNINEKMGNGVANGGWGNTSLPLFDNGKLLPYIGGQSNHNDPDLSFQDTLKIINVQLDSDAFEAVLQYYGYMNSTDENGDYLKDPEIQNGANTGFMPFVAEEGLLTYEPLAKNAMKITYNNGNDEFGLPAAQLALLDAIDGEANLYETSEFGKFSFGSNSWKVYENHSTDYTFKARKDIYINAEIKERD